MTDRYTAARLRLAEGLSDFLARPAVAFTIVLLALFSIGLTLAYMAAYTLFHILHAWSIL